MQTILNTPDDPAHDSLVEKKSDSSATPPMSIRSTRRSRSWPRSVSSIRKPDTWRMPPCAEARMGDCPNA